MGCGHGDFNSTSQPECFGFKRKHDFGYLNRLPSRAVDIEQDQKDRTKQPKAKKVRKDVQAKLNATVKQLTARISSEQRV